MDTNYYHKIILNFYSMPPEYLLLYLPKVIWEVFILPCPPIPTSKVWMDSWMDGWKDIDEIPLSQEQWFLNLSRLA